MAEAIRAEGKAHLLVPRAKCGYCGDRPARVQDLCCFCAEESPLCGGCDGSGEGAYEGTRCRDCRGKGIARKDATSSEPDR